MPPISNKIRVNNSEKDVLLLLFSLFAFHFLNEVCNKITYLLYENIHKTLSFARIIQYQHLHTHDKIAHE